MAYRISPKTYTIKGNLKKTIWEIYNGQTYLTSRPSEARAIAYVKTQENAETSERVTLLRKWAAEGGDSSDTIFNKYEQDKPQGWLSADLPNLTQRTAPFENRPVRCGRF